MLRAPVDPRRPDKVNRYSKSPQTGSGAGGGSSSGPPQSTAGSDDLMPDYMNIMGMIFSMSGLMMKMKWCAWLALYCSCISFANSRASDDAKQVLSSFMLSLSAVVMSYLQNPTPMTPPWAS